jgi:hypothetical protein
MVSCRRLPLASLNNVNNPRRSKRRKTSAPAEECNQENVGSEGDEEEPLLSTMDEEQEEGQETNEDQEAAGEEAPEEARGEAAAEQQEQEEEQDDGSGIWGGPPPIPSNINLRCKKQVEQYFPKLRGKGKMLPPPTFMMDIFLLAEWRQKTHDEQKTAKAEWMSKHAPEKKRLKNLVPGANCTCCQRKARNDRGRRRPTRQSRRRRGQEAAPLPDEANATQQPQEQAGIPYASLGSSQMERDNVLPVEKGPYKRTSTKKLEHARSVQGQGGIQALKAMHSANKSFARALTTCTVKPTELANKFVYTDPSRAPRVFGLQIWVNQVSETRMSGGILPANGLRRDKAEITYISSCKEDAERILDMVLVDAVDNRDNYEKKKFYGTGKRLVDHLNSVEAESKLRRSKPDAADMQESQDQIPLSLAPTSEAV